VTTPVIPHGRQQPTPTRCVAINRSWAVPVLGWSAVTAVALLVAVLIQIFVANATVVSEPLAPLEGCQSVSPATAALADGDDMRAGFLARPTTERPPADPTSVCR
jgi:hypothetical protein